MWWNSWLKSQTNQPSYVHETSQLPHALELSPWRNTVMSQVESQLWWQMIMLERDNALAAKVPFLPYVLSIAASGTGSERRSFSTGAKVLFQWLILCRSLQLKQNGNLQAEKLLNCRAVTQAQECIVPGLSPALSYPMRLTQRHNKGALWHYNRQWIQKASASWLRITALVFYSRGSWSAERISELHKVTGERLAKTSNPYYVSLVLATKYTLCLKK